jgi:hypothetical protein
MLESGILDEALGKKNKEVEKIAIQMEEMKKGYEIKIKNLMKSIEGLKSQKNEIENTTKDNIRVSIINKLKEERKDQEIVISLLRKLIGDEDKVDKFLLKEFDKKGNDHLPTYEELKLKIRQLEADIVSHKYKLMTNTTGKNKLATSYIERGKKANRIKNEDEDNEMGDQILSLKEKQSLIKYEEKIASLEEENRILKSAKDKMENIQTELFEKLKNYNSEIGEMKSIYDSIKQNIEDESNMKIKDLMTKMKKSESENFKYKEKIKELIQISENTTKENLEKIKQLISENDILKRLLESKKQETNSIILELSKYKTHFDRLDNKEVVKIQKVEKEKEEIKRKIMESEERISHLEKVVKQKDYQLDIIKQSMQDKDDLLNEKDGEIDLLQIKIKEIENIAMENFNMIKY